MIKVCYVIGTLEIGGAEKQLLKLIENLDRTKFTPVLIALRGGRMEGEFRDVVRVTVLRKRCKIDPLLLLRLISAIRREKPDILHTFMFTSNTWGRLAGIFCGVPAIISSERCVDLWKRWYHRFIDRRLLRFTSVVVCNSDAVREFYLKTERIPDDRMAVIHNGVDLEEFQRIDRSVAFRKKTVPGKAGFIIGAGGRFTEQKGFVSLLGAAPSVLKVFPGSVFVLVGDGPLMQPFRDFSARNNLGDSIVFTGYRRDILSIFAFCDVIVVPSLFEGMPNTVLEAMALKKPVVGTAIPEIAGLVEDGKSGLLVPVENNADSIAEKIILLLQNPALREKMGARGYEIISRRFSMRVMVGKYEEMYLA